MNKGEFVEALADRLDVSRAQAERSLGAVLETPGPSTRTDAASADDHARCGASMSVIGHAGALVAGRTTIVPVAVGGGGGASPDGAVASTVDGRGGRVHHRPPPSRGKQPHLRLCGIGLDRPEPIVNEQRDLILGLIADDPHVAGTVELWRHRQLA